MQIETIQRRRSWTLAWLGLIVIGLNGCTTKAVDPGFVVGRWSDTMKYYDFSSVFPPQDVMVGDIYLGYMMKKEVFAQLSSEEQAEEKKEENKRYFFRLTRLNVKPLLKSDWQKKNQFALHELPPVSLDSYLSERRPG
jgi:hypothetical protein